MRLNGTCSATLADGVFWDVSVRGAPLCSQLSTSSCCRPAVASVCHELVGCGHCQARPAHRRLPTLQLFAAGCTYVDDRLNASLYGDGVTAAEILGGRVALPEEFLPLYQAVDALAAEAQV